MLGDLAQLYNAVWDSPVAGSSTGRYVVLTTDEYESLTRHYVSDHLSDHHSRSLLQMTKGSVTVADKGWTYGIGGYQVPAKVPYSLQDGAVVACDWVGFLCLGGAAITLMYKLFNFRGPDGTVDYFVGYREEKVISVFVNLVAALTYWGRICAHFNGDVGLSLNVNYYKYFDYVFTCPTLTLDLLWSLNLPYKFTYSVFVLLTLVSGTFCNMVEPPARYLWFLMSAMIFAFTWYSIIRLVQMRFTQLMNEDAKKIRTPLKLSLMLYFTIWCGYPALWILDEFGLIPGIAVHVLSMMMDVAAKSVYGFALLKFQLGAEKDGYDFGELEKVKLAYGTMEMPQMIRPSKMRGSRHNSEYGDRDDQMPGGSRIQSRRNSYDRDQDDYRPDRGTRTDDSAFRSQEMDIDRTMTQIADLNKQLASLTQETARKPTRLLDDP